MDGKGKDHARIRQDGAECHGIAQSTNPEGQAAAGALAGAVVGALLGAVIFLRNCMVGCGHVPLN